MFDTIVAIASGGIINQPIGIIRLSGSNAFEITQKIFSKKIKTDKTIQLGEIIDNDKTVDEVVLWAAKSPNTFTGENTVEINAHGGIVVLQKILSLCLANGARIAEPGEFSRRAFLNGKLDLVKAEAIHDLIFSKTEKQANASVSKFNNYTSKFINDLINDVELLIGHIEVNIDYPEYDDIEELTNETILPKLINIKKMIHEAVSLSERAWPIFNGVTVAIVGKPNVGKSSLLNALIGQEKAIVTDIEGTTRDIVESQFQHNGILFTIKDSAGIRQHTNDVVEKIGIKKSLDVIKESEIIIHLYDEKFLQDETNLSIQKESKNKIYIPVINKSDLLADIKNDVVTISAKNEDIKKLLDELIKNYQDIDVENEHIVNNARQLSLLKLSLSSLDDAIIGIENGFSLDTIIIDLTQAWEHLQEITGKATNEKLLDQMFKSFCLGK